MNAQQILFYIFAGISLATALGVIFHPNPARSALLLVINFVCLAVFYVLLNAQVLAVLQILVYAGAIMVLFLFVIMLLNLGGEVGSIDPLSNMRFVAVLLGGGLAAGIGYAIVRMTAVAPVQSPDFERVRQAEQQGIPQIQIIGFDLLTRYVYPFELTSFLLLIGAIGVITLTKRRIDQEARRDARS